jgi:hypothetical protein
MRNTILITLAILSPWVMAEDIPDWKRAQATEVWEPVPPKIQLSEKGVPSDAVVLFDGSSLEAWQNLSGEDAEWAIEEGAFTVVPGKGDIQTRQSFCDVQLHLEWRSPIEKDKEGQGKGNSGVFLQSRYEVQVLDSHGSDTYPNGQASAVYKQHIPLVNATLPENTWQRYDIIFKAPRFNEDKSLDSPAYVTVLHNGVLVQNHVEIQGTTEWIGKPSYSAHGCAPIKLQDHSNKVSYRNIWVREL